MSVSYDQAKLAPLLSYHLSLLRSVTFNNLLDRLVAPVQLYIVLRWKLAQKKKLEYTMNSSKQYVLDGVVLIQISYRLQPSCRTSDFWKATDSGASLCEIFVKTAWISSVYFFEELILKIAEVET